MIKFSLKDRIQALKNLGQAKFSQKIRNNIDKPNNSLLIRRLSQPENPKNLNTETKITFKPTFSSPKEFFKSYQAIYNEEVLNMNSISIESSKPFNEIFTSGNPIKQINFHNCFFINNNFQTVKFKDINFINSKLTNNRFSLCTFEDVDFRECYLRDEGNNFSRAVFSNVKIDIEDFEYLKKQGISGTVLIETPHSNGEKFKRYSFDDDPFLPKECPEPLKSKHRPNQEDQTAIAIEVEQKPQQKDKPITTIKVEPKPQQENKPATKVKQAKQKSTTEEETNLDNLLSIDHGDSKFFGEKAIQEVQRLYKMYV